jgi:hypothetical protein
MKDLHPSLLIFIPAIFLISMVGYLVSRQPPEPTPTLYECPCESEELIKDVVRHTNKDGMKSVTTFVDVKGCLIVKE